MAEEKQEELFEDEDDEDFDLDYEDEDEKPWYKCLNTSCPNFEEEWEDNEGRCPTCGEAGEEVG